MEKSMKSQEGATKERIRRRVKTVSMSEITVRNSDSESKKRASMPVSMIRSLSDGTGRPAPMPEALIRSESHEMESPASMPVSMLRSLSDGTGRPAPMPNASIRSESHEMESPVKEDTIDEESKDELSQAIKARPSSNEMGNPAIIPRVRLRNAPLTIRGQENILSQVSNQSLPGTIYGTPCSGSGKRGYVLAIINHEFDGIYSTLPMGNDVEKIKNLFPRHNYIVVALFNQSKNEILDKINELACKEDSIGLICFISSHGDETSLACPIKKSAKTYMAPLATNEEKSVKIIDVLRCANTTQLQKCPKIFFIDACRTTSGKEIQGKHIPEPPGDDYYVGFSCLNQRTCEWQREDSCGMYFETLIKVFNDAFSRPATERNKVRDLNHLMEKVHHNLSRQNQIPVFKSTLSGKVFLHGHE